MEDLTEKLKSIERLQNVEAITKTKVPIIKLIFENPHLAADISMHNHLAMENTKLLHMYSSIDDRVPVSLILFELMFHSFIMILSRF